MIDHDRLFKELLRTFFVEFVELFLPQVYAYLEPDGLVFLDKEIFTDVVAGERHTADLVVKARFRGQMSCFLIHTEPQASRRHRRGKFGVRMFDYFARLTALHRLPVYPVALLSYDFPRDLEPDVWRVEFPDKVVLEFRYTVIQLNRLPWRDCLRRDNPVAGALMAKMGIAELERVTVKKECLRMIARLKLDAARSRLLTGFVDTYLRLSGSEQERFSQELKGLPKSEREEVMELTTSWKEEGIQIGLQQGRQEGECAIILRQLARRLGKISAASQKRIEHLSLPQLESLSEALLDFTRPADLTRWLEQLCSSRKAEIQSEDVSRWLLNWHQIVNQHQSYTFTF